MGAATVVSTVILMNISSWFNFLGDGITDVCGVHPRTIETGSSRQGRAVKALKTQKSQNVCWPPTSDREQIGDEGHICSIRLAAIEPDPGSTTLSPCVLNAPPIRGRYGGVSVMRKRNWRLIAVGSVLLVLAVLFFLSMRDMTPWSNDPAALMRTVGAV